jgi:hypothetical protein
VPKRTERPVVSLVDSWMKIIDVGALFILDKPGSP